MPDLDDTTEGGIPQDDPPAKAEPAGPTRRGSFRRRPRTFPLFANGPQCHGFTAGEWMAVLEMVDDSEVTDRDFALRTLVPQLVDPVDSDRVASLADGDLGSALATFMAHEHEWIASPSNHDPAIAEIREQIRAWGSAQAEKLRPQIEQFQSQMESMVGRLGLLDADAPIWRAVNRNQQMVADAMRQAQASTAFVNIDSLNKAIEAARPGLKAISEMSVPDVAPNELLAMTANIRDYRYETQVETLGALQDLRSAMTGFLSASVEQTGAELEQLILISGRLETLNQHQQNQTRSANTSKNLMIYTAIVSTIAVLVAIVLALTSRPGPASPAPSSTPSSQVLPAASLR